MMYGGDFVYRIMLYILGFIFIPVSTSIFTLIPIVCFGFPFLGIGVWLAVSITWFVIHVKWTKVVLPN